MHLNISEVNSKEMNLQLIIIDFVCSKVSFVCLLKLLDIGMLM